MISEDAPWPDESRDKVDIALVVVHGIGQQVRGETLQAWASPILRSLHAQVRARGGDVSISESNPTMEPAEVLAEVSLPGASTQRILITEARWAESFLAQSHIRVALWALSFSRSAYERIFRHLYRMANNPRTAQRKEERTSFARWPSATSIHTR